jgi:hypothetical protein
VISITDGKRPRCDLGHSRKKGVLRAMENQKVRALTRDKLAYRFFTAEYVDMNTFFD